MITAETMIITFAGKDRKTKGEGRNRKQQRNDAVSSFFLHSPLSCLCPQK